MAPIRLLKLLFQLKFDLCPANGRSLALIKAPRLPYGQKGGFGLESERLKFSNTANPSILHNIQMHSNI